MRRYLLAAALVVAALTAGVSAEGRTEGEKAGAEITPGSCDGKPVKFHVHRAERLIDKGYDQARIPDPSPMTDAERRALHGHKHCVLVDNPRKAIAKYRERAEKKYAAALGTYNAYGDIDPPGAAYLAGLRACESGGNYATNTGNGYYGAYQFDLGTWESVGGSGLPSNASPAEQDYRAALLWRQAGSAPWPVCG
jgi:hypothetical protein